MKICFLADSDSIHTKRWCEHFHSLGHEIHLISFKKTKIKNINCHSIDAGNISVQGGNWRVLFKVKKIRKLVRQINPDILHAHYATSYGLVGALSRFHPFIVTTLGTDVLISPEKSILYRNVLRFVFRKADWITLMASHMEKIISKFKLTDLNKTSVVPFGIDTRIFNSMNRSVSSTEFVITSTRNFEEVYNIPHLLKAVALIRDKIPNLKLNLIGDGSKRTDIEKLAAELGLKEITIFYGRVNQNKIAEVLNHSHIFVSVSLSDGNNISLNEAMACGAYCIATNISANAQWIIDNENGRLVEINDFAGLGKLILESFENYKVISEKAQTQNKSIIKEKADWFVNMQIVESKYRELCKKK